jgi:hypothetical protein
VEFDPFDDGFHRDPYPTYAWLREPRVREWTNTVSIPVGTRAGADGA